MCLSSLACDGLLTRTRAGRGARCAACPPPCRTCAPQSSRRTAPRRARLDAALAAGKEEEEEEEEDDEWAQAEAAWAAAEAEADAAG